MKKLVLLLIVSISFLQFSTAQPMPFHRGDILFVAKLTGEFVVPAVATTAVGEANMMMNENMDTLCINIILKGLSGAVTSIAIYEGPQGGIGPMVMDLQPFLSGNTISTSLTGMAITPALRHAMFGRNLYINVTTSNNTAGEIRGQIELETDFAYKANMLPLNGASSEGLAIFELSRSLIDLHVSASFRGLNGAITLCQLLTANDSLLADLTSLVQNDRIDAQLNISGLQTRIVNGEVHMKATTATQEMRGNVTMIPGLVFDTWLEQSQPSQFSTGYLYFSPAMDSIYYDFVYTNIPGITDVSLETQMGPSMTVSLINGVSGINRLTGVYGGPIPPGFVREALKGNVVMNLVGPGITFRLYRYLRDGFTYQLNGAQEVPPTNSSAYGSGMASIDRHMLNLHFRMIVNDLTGPLVGAHFHEASADSTGPVIFDLTPYFAASGTSDQAFNYWLSNAAFDSQAAMKFESGRVYVNVHTAQFLSGEIRGQVIPGGTCYSSVVGIGELQAFNQSAIYPNPATNNTTVSFTSSVTGSAVLSVLDYSGRMIKEVPVSVLSGENKYDLPVADIANGVYLIQIAMKNYNPLRARLIKN